MSPDTFYSMIVSVICQENFLDLSEMRHIKGYSQKQLADLMGVGRSTISEWEHGKYLPSQENIEKLGEILEIDPSVLDTLLKAKYHARQLKLLGCSVEDYEFLYEQVA